MGTCARELYVDDLVLKITQGRLVYGLVVESYESTDSDDYISLKRGQVVVSWHKPGRKQICRQTRLYLLNRCIVPGDVVRRLVDGVETQRGYCKDCEQQVTMQIVGTDKVVENIPHARLLSVRIFEVGDAVCMGRKFGRIQAVHQTLKMTARCGSVVEVRNSVNYAVIRDYWAEQLYGDYCDPCYPGQVVVCRPSDLKDAKWLRKSRTMTLLSDMDQFFTIQSVTYSSIEVWWCSYNNKLHPQFDYAELTPKQIKRLKVIPYTFRVNLMDRMFFKLQPSDKMCKKADWLHKQTQFYRRQFRLAANVKSSSPAPENLNESNNNACVNSEPEFSDWDTEEEEECATNDEQKGTPADIAVPATMFGDSSQSPRTKEFVGTDKLNDLPPPSSVEKAEPNRPASNVPSFSTPSVSTRKSRRSLISGNKYLHGQLAPVDVLSVTSNITVVWQDGTEEKHIPSTDLYYSVSIDEHEFFPGEWVSSTRSMQTTEDRLRFGVIQRVDTLQRTALVRWYEYCTEYPDFVCTAEGASQLAALLAAKQTSNESGKFEEISVYEITKHEAFIFRPGCIVREKPAIHNRMGRIIDCHSTGCISVAWLNGQKENCWPHALEVIPDNEEYDFSDQDNSEDFDDFSCEVVYEYDEMNSSLLSGSWETESMESYDFDVLDDINVEYMVTKVDFIRDRIVRLKELIRKHNSAQLDHQVFKDLLCVYDNSTYLDKFLGTSFFNTDGTHFQIILREIVQLAKLRGVDVNGRPYNLLSKSNARTVTTLPANTSTIADQPPANASDANPAATGASAPITTGTVLVSMSNVPRSSSVRLKYAAEENIQTMMKVQKLLENSQCDTQSSTTTTTPANLRDYSLALELLTMIKMRLDLIYAEMISRLWDGKQAISILSDLDKSSGVQAQQSQPEIQTVSSTTPSPTSYNTQISNEVSAEHSVSIEIPTTNAAPAAAAAATDSNRSTLPKVDKIIPNELTSTVSNIDVFSILDIDAPVSHKFYHNEFTPNDSSKFMARLQKEYMLLMESLPRSGCCWLRTYSARMDLWSLMIMGPDKTPYEDGLFLFDLQLSKDYPANPPLVHYISFTDERLNPNLYVEGRVCVSLLGTWKGRGSEVWTANRSNLWQLIVSIQGLILVAEPYYNEAGYERQAHTQQGCENSRTYNEIVILKLVESMTALLLNIPQVFHDEIIAHFRDRGQRMYERLQHYCNLDEDSIKHNKAIDMPDFPLVPVTKGLKLSLARALERFQKVLNMIVFDNVSPTSPPPPTTATTPIEETPKK